MTRLTRSHGRIAVGVVKIGVLSTLTALAIGTTPITMGVAPAPAEATPSSSQLRLDRLMSQHECSATGFAADVIPGSALVQRGDRVEFVSFDDGWAVYTGDAPGTLLAVCRASA